MTDQLARFAELMAKRTQSRWVLDYPGHGERCVPAVISMPSEGYARAYEVVVDHRRDFSDPLPDAKAICAAVNTSEAFVRVAQVVSVFGFDPAQDHKDHKRLQDALADLEASLAEALK
jgi:hypothetical protein